MDYFFLFVFKGGLNLSSCSCSFGFSGKRKKIEHQAGADFLPSTRPPLVTVTSHSKVFLSSKCKALSPWASKKKRKPLLEVVLVAADEYLCVPHKPLHTFLWHCIHFVISGSGSFKKEDQLWSSQIKWHACCTGVPSLKPAVLIAARSR